MCSRQIHPKTVQPPRLYPRGYLGASMEPTRELFGQSLTTAQRGHAGEIYQGQKHVHAPRPNAVPSRLDTVDLYFNVATDRTSWSFDMGNSG